MKKYTLLVLLCTILLQSCSSYTPEQYIGRTTLNANKFIDFGSRKINSMIAQRDADMLYEMDGGEMVKTKSIEKHVETFLLTDISNDIEKIEALSVAEDSKEMIEKSLALFNYVKDSYEIDYITIAKLVDANGNSTEIDKLIRELDNEKQSKIVEMHNELLDATVLYAGANGVAFRRP